VQRKLGGRPSAWRLLLIAGLGFMRIVASQSQQQWPPDQLKIRLRAVFGSTFCRCLWRAVGL
jgi:hypothetical protein